MLKDCDDFLKGLSTARVKNVQEASDTGACDSSPLSPVCLTTQCVVVAYDGRRSHARRQLKRKAKQDFELQVEQAQVSQVLTGATRATSSLTCISDCSRRSRIDQRVQEAYYAATQWTMKA